MAKSLNRVTLLGNLGADPEFRTTPNGQSVATLSLATTSSYRDKQGERIEQTEWHRLICWERLAEIAHDYLKKGSKIYVEGKLRSRSYEDKEKITRYTTEIIVGELILLTPKDGHSSSESSSRSSANVTSNVAPLEPDIQDVPEDDVPF
ncbi:MAG: single-stranded DNA-binding protein [bacterium]